MAEDLSFVSFIEPLDSNGDLEVRMFRKIHPF